MGPAAPMVIGADINNAIRTVRALRRVPGAFPGRGRARGLERVSGRSLGRVPARAEGWGMCGVPAGRVAVGC